ncbi:uncharacterized protein B0T23DRAFT_395080 [Neurospora hispaniola]|uniref:NADH-ubiquinone oxidoreductase 14.8 kDa subunit n=1 Tax=Neurospora hispaniola TaxID=588809 RepID=A0AAJ0IB05_9PEZI|nr:hypothetical protein B0T23DRAFT_395080 [Neurospora hispaniola]
MPITPTKYAITTRQSANWSDAKRRVFALYRRWLRSTPEMQSMYSLPLPISVIRTRIRQEFERNRFVNKLPVVDVLLTKGHADYQVRLHFIVTIHTDMNQGIPRNGHSSGVCPKSGEHPKRRGKGFQTRGQKGISERWRMLCVAAIRTVIVMETMNFWRQTTHMMSYFNEESFRGAKRLPSSFIDGFLQGRN